MNAITTLKLKSVPVAYVEFETEKEAIEYAIRVQRDRRNISDVDIAKRILLVDEVKERGGDHKSEDYEKSKSSVEPFEKNEESATTTAKKAGTSASKVKKLRAVKPEIAMSKIA